MVRAHTSERQLCPAVREQVPTLLALGRGGMQALWLSLGQPPCMIEPASAGPSIGGPGYGRTPAASRWHWTGTELALNWHWSGTGLALVWHWSGPGLALGWHWSWTGIGLAQAQDWQGGRGFHV